MDEDVVLGLNEVPSLNTVLRALKREETSLYNCVASIVEDALFVQQVTSLYPHLPLFPNLRCGLWYVRPPVGNTCYFKSTDGHNGNWSFSTVRLNLHLAEAAAAAGGCVIVDATKRGKRFPDAMSKTIPMWAAVLNRAVHRLRRAGSQSFEAAAGRPNGDGPADTGTQQSAESAAVAAAAAAAAEAPPASVGAAAGAGDAAAAAAAAAAEAGSEAAWDTDVHLPPWVSHVEANSIRQLLDGWADQLLQVGADLSTLVATLHKPLRCLWVSQDTRIWLDTVADTASLDFTPIILVGASATTARQRRCLTLPPERPGEDPLSVTYCYFPGAADDDEKWAHGLTPELMWRHLRALLAAGPQDVHSLVAQLLEEQQVQLLQQGSAAAEQTQQAGVHGTDSREGQGRQQTNGAAAAARPAAGQQQAAAAAALVQPAVVQPAAADALAAGPLQQATGQGLHCLLPQGCLPAQAANVQQLGSGIFVLGSTGLALGSAKGAAAPAVWQHVDAVLHLGALPLAGMQQEPQPGRHLLLQQQQGPTEQQTRQQEGAKQHTVSAAGGSRGHDSTTSAASCASCRFCWLPVQSSKVERHSLQAHLSAALRFAHAQLRQGRRLLLCCDSGLDTSVCVAVACLLAFYRLNEQPGGGLLPEWVGAPASVSGSASREPTAAAALEPAQPLLPVVGPAGLSKLAVRQHLAAVSAHYPAGRPTRGSLRQVFNFFLSEMGLPHG